MAVVADLWLCRGLHHGIAWRVADVAIGAGDLVVVMWPAMPAETDVGIVASKAHVILDTNLGLLMRTKFDEGRSLLAAPDPGRVRPAGTVAGLALQLSVTEGAARIGGHCVFGTKYR